MATKLELFLNEEKQKSENKNAINIDVKSGYWTINGKDLKECSIAKKNLFAQFVKMKLVKLPIPGTQSSFKKRSQFIKETYNYVFKMREQNFIGTFPNIETLTFVKK